MSFLARFEPEYMTAAQYDDSLRLLGESGVQFPPKGLEYHVCFGEEGQLAVSEIWSSKEDFEAFGDHLKPVLAKAGIKLAGPPKILQLHNSLLP
jgi:hypothetical protein